MQFDEKKHMALVRKGIEVLSASHRQKHRAIKIIRQRIADLEKRMEDGGDIPLITQEIHGLEYALDALEEQA